MVLVLGIIMILIIFGTVLAVKATSTQMQIEKTENHMDAQNIARMGMEYAFAEVRKAYGTYTLALEQAKKTDGTLNEQKKTEYFRGFKNTVEALTSLNATMLDANRSFKITTSEINEMVIKIDVKGTADGETVIETSRTPIQAVGE